MSHTTKAQKNAKAPGVALVNANATAKTKAKRKSKAKTKAIAKPKTKAKTKTKAKPAKKPHGETGSTAKQGASASKKLLASLHCTGCKKRCPLSDPRCKKGRAQADDFLKSNK